MLLLITYLFNFYIQPEFWVPIFKGLPWGYIAVILCLFYGLFLQAHENKPLLRQPQYGLLAISLIIIFLSNAFHDQVIFGIAQVYKYLKQICIFAAVLLIVNSTKKLKITIIVMLAFSAFLAIQSIHQTMTGGAGLAGQGFSASGAEGRVRWVGLWDGPNVFALLLLVAVPFALEFAFGPYRKSFKILNLLLAGCLVFGIYLSNSRGGFVALLATLFIYPFFKIRKKSMAIIGGVILAGAILVYLAPSRSGQIDTSEASAYSRTQLWNAALDMFMENKLFGAGKGKFTEHTTREQIAHSNFMQNLGETGLVGILNWMAIVYFSFKALYLVYKEPPVKKKGSETLNSLSRALLTSFVGFNICTSFVTMEIDLFYLLLGLCAATANIMNKEIKPLKVTIQLRDTIFILMIILALLVFYKIQIMRA